MGRFAGEPVLSELPDVGQYPQLAYAWSHETDDGKINYVAVLGVPPIDSPQRAVQAQSWRTLNRARSDAAEKTAQRR